MIGRLTVCTEHRMFRILDRLKPKATGLDGLPAWFMRLGAPVFSRTLADLINLSISTSAVPTQWKRARICPVPKTSNPTLWTLSGKSDAHTFEDLCNSADDELFSKIKTSPNHILHALLPPPSIASQNYGLRQRAHSFQLPERSTHLCDCNFLMRMLYKNSY